MLAALVSSFVSSAGSVIVVLTVPVITVLVGTLIGSVTDLFSVSTKLGVLLFMLTSRRGTNLAFPTILPIAHMGRPVYLLSTL